MVRNFVKELKSESLPAGFIGVCGAQGAGKTSLVTALLRTDFKRWGKWRYRQGLELAKAYYAVNGIKLNVSENLYFTNTPVLLDRRRGIVSHKIELSELGLPNDENDVQYLPRGSVVFIQEADVLAWCRDWENLNVYLRTLLKYVRHNLVTVIFDMQVGGNLDKALRELETEMLYVIENGIKRFLFFFKRQCWRFLCVKVQLNNVVREFSQLGVKIKIPVVSWGKFHVCGNVFNCYDSFSGQRYFLYGIEKHGYQYREHVRGGLSVEDINAFVAAHPLAQADNGKRKRK